VLAGLAVLFATGAFVLWPRPDRVTEENVGRIREGMSRAEVYAILGPPGDHLTGPVEYLQDGFVECNENDFGLQFEGEYWARWLGDRTLVDLEFGEDGCVIGGFSKYHYTGRRVEQGPLDNLLWRAKRQWRRWFPER
jgi:hypothetical protein